MDWRMTKNKPDGGKRFSNIICIGAIACRGSSWSDMADVLVGLVLEPQSCSSKVAAAVLGRSGVAAVLAWRGAAAELGCGAAAELTKRAVPSWSGIAPSRYVWALGILALGIFGFGIFGFPFVGLVFGRRLYDLRCSVKNPSINWCINFLVGV